MTSSEGASRSARIASLSGGPVPAETSAASLLAVAPAIVIGRVTQRQRARGLTFGAVR